MRGLIVTAAFAAFAVLGFSACGKEQENLARRAYTFPNSKALKSEWTIKTLPSGDTAMHGVAKEYYWGGSVKKSVVWKDGQKDGSAQAWYDNGGQQWQKSYDKGRKTGTWRLFYSDGNPWIVMAFNAQGMLEGKVQKWDRADPSQPKESTYAGGTCTSGDCTLLELPQVPEGAPQAAKVQITRDQEILADFLD